MSAITRPHVLIIGTGLTSLTLARALLTHTPALEIQLTLIDKARNPGGRLTSRKYDSGVILETGARVFETPLSQKEGGEGAFGREVEAWEQQGWVREVKREKLKGSSIGPGRWWEGTNGLTKGLVEGLLEEVKASSNGRLNIHYEVMAGKSTPTSSAAPYTLTLEPAINDLPPADILVHTAPSPQTTALLSDSMQPPSTTQYLKTFALLLPTITVPDLPVYWRDPHPSLNSIATGLAPGSSGEAAGLVIQSTPEKLGLPYAKDEASDDKVREAFFRVLKESGTLDSGVLAEAEKKTGRESQVKRWKFAQVVDAVKDGQGASSDDEHEPIQVIGERCILAGDGTAGGRGGLEGAWRAAMSAKSTILGWLKDAEVGGKL